MRSKQTLGKSGMGAWKMQAGVKADLKASQGECLPDDWVAAKELKLNYCSEETPSFTIYPYHGNLAKFLTSNPDEDSLASSRQSSCRPSGRAT